ncbi:MAG: MCE family protein [Myxococcales bacterium]|nr:MCE family protein [Myxococcales bacterium]
MRDERRNYVVVGGFVLLALAGLLAWVLLISGRTGAVDAYTISYENVMGLKSGTEILFEGYPVGLIQGIHPVLDDGRQRFRVDVSVQRGWRIPEDSLARITAPGLLSAFAIDIRGGASQRMLSPGDAIAGEEASNVLDVVAGVNSVLVERIEPWLDEMSAGTLAISSNLEDFTKDLRGTMSRIDGLVNDDNIGRIEGILENLDGASGDISSIAGDLDDTLVIVEKLLTDLDVIVELNRDDLTQTVADARITLETISRYVESVAFNLDTTMRNMSEFSREIRENPALILRGTATDAGAVE